ncbi:MAG: glycosyltransferase, partial [Planctomycetes bacterium]|nr:glycosyltransferase [Planctomycetota bacterium]
ALHNAAYGASDLFHYTLGGVPVSQYRPVGDDVRRRPTREEGVPFLDVVERACARHRPDVVLTYGGPPVGPHLIRRVRRHGARVVFALHNAAYGASDLFREVDAVWAPSEFGRRLYRERLGREVAAVPWPWDRARAVVDLPPTGRFVTFVNPTPAKGAAWFARIALEVSRRRPDVPFLVVEGRGGAGWLRRLPVDLSGLTNVRGMHSTPLPKKFYALSRAVLMPSLAEETFGRVAAEALANGLPVLVTRRGALPELLDGAGFAFDIPDRYAANHMAVPSAEEVAPWVAAIERLWDDPDFYAEHRSRALERSRAWEPDRLRPGIEAFFRRVAAGG